jgi:hypothetical protein
VGRSSKQNGILGAEMLKETLIQHLDLSRIEAASAADLQVRLQARDLGFF